MPHLFTALWPTRHVVAELEAALADRSDGADHWPPEGWRAISPRRWHVTLCFHGEADPGVLARQLDSLATGVDAPWLRLAGAVSFDSVTAAAVHPAGGRDAAAMAALGSAAGADHDTHRPPMSAWRVPLAGRTVHLWAARWNGSWARGGAPTRSVSYGPSYRRARPRRHAVNAECDTW